MNNITEKQTSFLRELRDELRQKSQCAAIDGGYGLEYQSLRYDLGNENSGHIAQGYCAILDQKEILDDWRRDAKFFRIGLFNLIVNKSLPTDAQIGALTQEEASNLIYALKNANGFRSAILWRTGQLAKLPTSRIDLENDVIRDFINSITMHELAESIADARAMQSR